MSYLFLNIIQFYQSELIAVQVVISLMYLLLFNIEQFYLVFTSTNPLSLILSIWSPFSNTIPLSANSSLTLLKYVLSGYAKFENPPCVPVLWWTEFQTTTFFAPVVTESPTINVCLLLNHLIKSKSTSLPSWVSGRKAVRCVPIKFIRNQSEYYTNFFKFY